MSQSRPYPWSLLLRAFFVAGLFALLLMNPAFVRAQESQRAILSRTRPEYPALAIRMHIGGSVHVVATVKPDGTVSNVRATSGHPFLQGPAEQAVRQWKFAKSPAPTDTAVEVQFQLDAHS